MIKSCRVRGLSRAVFSLLTLLVGSGSRAQAQGFQLQQYEPAAAGERHLAVEAPWYAPTRTFAAALTLNYGHDVLQGGKLVHGRFEGKGVVDHQTALHFDVAYSPWERLRISASVPLTLHESGQTRAGVSPTSGAVVNDPRLGAALRLYGDAERDAFSAHLSGAVWIPVGAEQEHAGDQRARGRLMAVFAGYVLKNLSWATNAGVLLRKQAGLNSNETGPGTVRNELQANLALAYANDARTLHVGPEFLFGSVLGDGRTFKQQGSHLEALLSGTYRTAYGLQAGAALGVGIVRTPGTPDVRGLLRLGYAPTHKKAKPASEPQVRSGFQQQASPVPASEPEVVEREPRELVAATEPEAEVVEAPAAVAEIPVAAAERSVAVAETPVAAAERSVAVAVAVAEPAPEPEPAAPALAHSAEEKPQVASPAAPKRAASTSLLALPIIRFRKGQSTPSDEAGLARAAEILLAHPEVRTVKVHGHSDETGTVEFNQWLSLSRARAVARFLAEQGIPASKLEVRGKGSSEPLVVSEDSAQSAKNRRVQISVTLESR